MTASRVRFDQRIAGLGPDILAPELDERPLPVAPARRRSRRGRSATPCSTSARSRASATCGSARAASTPGSIRGGRPATSPTTRRCGSCASRARACSSPRARASRFAAPRSTATPAGPVRAAARRSARAGRETTTARHTGARDASTEAHRPQGRRPHRAGQHARLLRRGAGRRRGHGRVRRAARAPRPLGPPRARPRLRRRGAARAAHARGGPRPLRPGRLGGHRARRRPQDHGLRAPRHRRAARVRAGRARARSRPWRRRACASSARRRRTSASAGRCPKLRRNYLANPFTKVPALLRRPVRAHGAARARGAGDQATAASTRSCRTGRS